VKHLEASGVPIAGNGLSQIRSEPLAPDADPATKSESWQNKVNDPVESRMLASAWQTRAADEPSRTSMNALEKAVVRLDEVPWSAIYRIAFGFLLIPISTWLFGDAGTRRMLVPVMFSLLILIRLIALVGRAVLPFSRDVKTLWYERRQLGKRYDSYQWRKLVWIGLGLAIAIPFFQVLRPVPVIVTACCLASGAAGSLVWHRTRSQLSTASVGSRPLATDDDI
jgi:hypothetical protein